MRRALLIGNNYTGTDAELQGCHNDVENMRQLLVPLGYECEVLLEATRQQILDSLRDLVDSARFHGVKKLFFHFSGHGSQSLGALSSRFPLLGLLLRGKNSGQDEEADGADETICGVDGQVLDDELYEVLRGLPAGAQLVGLLDCCHSGTAFDLRYTFESSTQCTVNSREDLFSRVLMFSGCGDSQTSSDVPGTSGGSEPHGAMTRAFIDILDELPDTSPLQGVLKSLRGLLRERGFTQRPCLSLGYFEDITRSLLSL